MYYKTSTPGSLMIMGEHSVLHSYPSIVAAIDKYMHVSVCRGKLGKVRIESDYFGLYETEIRNIKPSKDFDIILEAVRRYEGLLQDGIDIQVKSDFSPELGLGSSGALLVGTVSALMMMLGKDVRQEELLHATLSILQNIRRFASGSDLAASIYNGVVRFDPKTCTAKVIADTLPIITAYSGYKTKTDDVVAKIHEEFNEDDLLRIYKENGDITDRAVLAICNKDYEELGSLMNASNKLVYESLELITGELQNILQEFKKHSCIHGAKVSGAGLGDCAIAVGSDVTQLEANHFNLLSLSIVSSSLRKADIVHKVLGDKINCDPVKVSGTSFASSNIALCKYWGKRDEELHLPSNSSLSISLDGLGSRTSITLSQEDKVILNGELLSTDSLFVSRIFSFIDLFRKSHHRFSVEIESNIPIGAGLASSAAGFAALILALNDLFLWQLSTKSLSILARLGSGSAARSIETGFVQWHKGSRDDGMDSYAVKLPMTWPGLCIGILTIDKQHKPVSSRTAMKITKETSPIFESWTERAEQDIPLLISAIKNKDFIEFGRVLEKNSNLMHDTMAASDPKIIYSTTETYAIIEKIRDCRETLGLPVFYTQDAGPNLIIFFEKKDEKTVESIFALNLPNTLLYS